MLLTKMNLSKKQSWRASLALLFVTASLTVATSLTAHADPPGGTAGWTRTFNEDFDGMTKNGQSFTTPSGNKWATCFYWGDGSINDGSGNYYSIRDMYTSNGNLVMPVVRNADGTFEGSLANTNPNVSGQSSAGTFSQLYGYFEARVKISMTDGDAPYFGLPPVSNYYLPEIEIFEIPSGWSNMGQGVHFLTKTGDDAANKSAGEWRPGGGFRFQDDYHIFACQWEPGLMVFYVDGVERYRTTKGVPAEASFLNLGHGCGIGANPSWDGNANNGTWPQNTLVDWVRVWRNTGSVPPANVAPIGQTIAIRSLSNGFFVTADLNQSGTVPLIAGRATTANGWERFRVDDAGNGQIALLSLNNNRYVSVDNTRGDKLLRAAWATGIGGWEKFSWESRGGSSFAIKSNVTGKYVSSDLSNGGNLVASWADSVGGWEQFEWQPQ